MDTLTALRTRRAVRKYTDDPVKPEDLETILDCGRYAPCGINRQSWRFIVVTDPAVREKIYEANKRFCKFILQAPVLVVVAVGPDSVTPFEDSAAATCNMLNAAHDLGYGTCWLSANGISADLPAYFMATETGKAVNLPEDWHVMSVFTLGVPAETPHKEKKPLGDIVSYNSF